MNNPLDLFKNFLSMGKNPMEIREMIFNQNPNLRAIYTQMEQSGMTPVDFVMQLARQSNMPIQQNAVNQYYQQMINMTK